MATDENALRALFAAQPATGAPAHAGFAAQWKSLAQSVPVPEEVVEIGAEDGRGSVFGADAAFAFTEGEAAEMVQIYRAQALLWLNLMRHQGSQL